MRKIIDIPDSIKLDLEEIAISDGLSLKVWIEGILINRVKNYRDAKRN